jgi:2'-hydroxyisoflavone reductase
MRLLVIGGTRFVGRHVVAAALQAGHQVTLFHRGGSSDPFGEAEHRHGDRNGDLSQLATGEWDATIDVCGYVPRQVRALGDALGGVNGRAGRYLFVSSVSAYVDPDGPGITENAPLAMLSDPDDEEVTPLTYGGLKALCEYAAVEAFGTSSLIVRPTYVVGPHDSTGRFTYWVRRLAAGGDVLAPGPEDDPMQVIDARDLATFMVSLVEAGESGHLHVAAPQPTYSFGDLLEDVAAAVAPPRTVLHWVGGDQLLRQDLTPAELPLWVPGEPAWSLAADASAALARGLAARPVGDTARDVLKDDDTQVPAGIGLTLERELRVLREVGALGT